MTNITITNIRKKLSFRLIIILIAILPSFLFANSGSKINIENNVEYGKATNAQGVLESLALDVYKKSDSKGKNLACVILIHGGGFAGGDKQQDLYVRMAKEFASRNYVVFSINYRLKIGRDSAYADARTALEWIKKNFQEYGIDISKILVIGDSAGGAIAVNLAYSNPQKTKLAGVIDLWGGLSPVRPAYTHNPGWDESIYSVPN